MLDLSRRSRVRLFLRIIPTLVPIAAAACSSSPTSPLEISQLSLGAAYDVYVEGETAFVSNNQGIAILDIGDIDHPRQITTVRGGSSNSIVGFHLSGDTLFTYGDRLSIYGLRGDDEPQLLDSYSGRDYVSGAQRRGDYLYLVYLHGGLDVVDFSDPAVPVPVGFVPFSGQVNDWALVGDLAYVANSSTGLEVFDLQDPSAPVRLGAVSGTGGAWDIHIVQDRLYLACHRYGVKVLDISDPVDPSVLGSFNNGGETYGVHGVGNLLYTVDLQQGVEVLDISSPAQPSLVLQVRHYHPHDLFSDGEYVYLADQDEHFVVLPMELGGAS